MDRSQASTSGAPRLAGTAVPLIDLQRAAGNRAVAALIAGGATVAGGPPDPMPPIPVPDRHAVAPVQRERRRGRSRGTVTIATTENIPAALALDAILRREAGAERLGEIPGRAGTAARTLLGAMNGEGPGGRKNLSITERLRLFDASAPTLVALLDAALREAGDDLDEATRAKRTLQATRTGLVMGTAQEAAVDDARAAELVSPKVKAERMTLAEAAKAGLTVYLRGEKFIGGADVPGLTKELRQSRITVLEGVITLANTDDWPSYQKAVAAIDKQLARTDPDRMLGAGATVLEHMRKATTFVIKSVQLMGVGMKSILVARGMLQEAALMGKSLEGVAKLSKALAVVNVLHGAMVLLDDKASASKKIGAGLEFASGTVSVTAVGAEALGMTATAGAAATAGTVLGGAAITYESYKALAEYGYTSVVGGLSYAAIDEELEGTAITTSRGRGRARGGLEPLGRELSVHRARVESLDKQLAGAPADDRAGISRALADEVRRLQRAVYDLAKRWAATPQPVLRDRMPVEDELEWQNAMSAGAEPWMVVDIATRWEKALTKVFMDKDAIADETMHATMKRKR